MRTCTDSHLCLPVPQLFPYSLLSFQIFQMNHLCSYLKSIPHIQSPLIFSWILHWLFFPFAPISSFFPYILNHSHRHINTSSILKTNEIFPPISLLPAALLLHFSSPCNSKIPPSVVYTCCHQCFSSFESLLSQAFLFTSPLQLLWSRASVITPLNPIINSQPSSFLNVLQCLKQVTPTSFRHFLHFSSSKLEYLVVFPALFPVSIAGCSVFS